MAYVRFCGAPSEWRISTTFGCVYFTALAYLNLNNPQASRRAFIGKKLLKTELLRTDNNDPVETPVKLRQQLLSPMPISWLPAPTLHIALLRVIPVIALSGPHSRSSLSTRLAATVSRPAGEGQHRAAWPNCSFRNGPGL